MAMSSLVVDGFQIHPPNHLNGCQHRVASTLRRAHAEAIAKKHEDDQECQVDEPALECTLRNQVDGPWADTWAKYVLLRPGMSYQELKAATQKRNQLDPSERIPGTARTVVLTHAICFLCAIPAVLRSDAVLPKLVEAAAIGRASSGLP